VSTYAFSGTIRASARLAMAEERAMATAWAAQACTPSRVSTSLEAKPQQPLARARIPSPSDSLSASVPTSPFLVLRSRKRRSTTRASAKEAPRVFAVSMARAVHTCMSPTRPETIAGGARFFDLAERGPEAVFRWGVGTRRPENSPFPGRVFHKNSHGFQL